MAKVQFFKTADEAVADMTAGIMLCVGGFGPTRNRAVDLLEALSRRPEVNNITMVSNSFPHQPLAENKQIKKLIAAFGGSVYRRAAASEEQIRSGELEFEPSPQGIFTERLRAGAGGMLGFFSPVGVDTVVADGKERRTVDGRDYIFETALRPDYGFVRAATADENGNLTGIGSTLNFHPTMAAASRITIAEVDEIVPNGSIQPEDVRIPHIYVDRIVVHDKSKDVDFEAQERQRRARREVPREKEIGLSQDLMALYASQLLKPGQYVNLGMGIPVRIGDFISPESGITLHAENGLLGYGPPPTEENYKWYYYNAQGEPVTMHPGSAIFDSFAAFTMARGGHLDVVVLGGLQVSATGDLANWWAPYMAAGGMGGAMDLCTDVPELIVLMEHLTRDGATKVLNECSYPLTGKGCVTTIITDLAHMRVTPEGLVLVATAPGVTAEYVQEHTEPRLIIAPDCHEMDFSAISAIASL